MVEVILLGLTVWAVVRLVRYIRMRRYFSSDRFLEHKERVAAFVSEHNEVGRYTSEIRERGLFRLGASSTGTQAHLASTQNTSHWNYRRDRNVANFQATNVHNCSLQVVRNASADPLKYVMKYFNIRPDETTLTVVEELNDNIVRLENAVANLRGRESAVTEWIKPPWFIRKHYMRRFMAEVGVELSPITVPYPVYVFEYVSAGGNSSQRTTVTLEPATLDALIETVGQKIRWRKSAAGQRALMTSRLRNFIKERDNFACRRCQVSIAVEPHLLLEVDHIIPVSKGGLSSPENLQTLCWRCNRTKSNKIDGNSAPTRPKDHSTASAESRSSDRPQRTASQSVPPVRPESVDRTAPRPSRDSEGEFPPRAWQPGDIANGHILGRDNRWHPLSPDK